jgi:carbonic anhydrase
MFNARGKNANIVIFCSDPRVVKWLNNNEIRAKLDLADSFGAISATGSIKFFLNEKISDKLFRQLDILVEHFQPEKIIILNHTDCGYYKSLNQDEEKFYLADLATAQDLISQKYPSLKIETYLLDTESGTLKS